MKKVLFLLVMLMSSMMTFAQIHHELFGMPLGSKEADVFAAWNEKNVEYEQSSDFKDLYRIKSKDEKGRTNPTTIDAVFFRHRLFSVRYTYPRDHYETICDLIRLTYTPYFKYEDEGMKSYFDDKTQQFIVIGVDDEHTYLTYGINMMERPEN